MIHEGGAFWSTWDRLSVNDEGSTFSSQSRHWDFYFVCFLLMSILLSKANISRYLPPSKNLPSCLAYWLLQKLKVCFYFTVCIITVARAAPSVQPLSFYLFASLPGQPNVSENANLKWYLCLCVYLLPAFSFGFCYQVTAIIRSLKNKTVKWKFLAFVNVVR